MNKPYKISFTFLDKGDKVWTKTFWSKHDMKEFIKQIKPHAATLNIHNE